MGHAQVTSDTVSHTPGRSATYTSYTLNRIRAAIKRPSF